MSRFGKRPIVDIQQISPDYTKTLGVSLLAGREFTSRDDAQAPKVALINQRMMRRFSPNESPIGKRIWVGNLPDPAEVVGVLGDMELGYGGGSGGGSFSAVSAASLDLLVFEHPHHRGSPQPDLSGAA